MIRQRTLKNAIHATGIGVHLGEKVYLTLRPAPINTGIIFRRVDLNEPVEIPAQVAFIGNTDLCTCLEKKEVRISTVEHLLSAFAGLNIDNCYVDLSLSELPIMDGSSSPFIFLIESAGIEEQDAPKKFIKIKKTIEVRVGEKFAKLEPFDGFRVAFEIAFNHPVISNSQQSIIVDFSSASYVKDISRARTFGFLADYEMIREKNLARGASLDNAIVLDTIKIMNEEGLRYPDEFVKHKILDVVGDLYLLGHNLIGAFTGYKSGHAINNALMRELLSQKDAWELITFDDASKAPLCYSTAQSVTA
ncbi:MAG TPA: UDP-3-O-acyl-N-acetylglucosamine deacetylase [Coxiellaceae bacterium]|nr:MAG: UDP-3-O-[3-hydroxymyristoyl] N-acetylglucosamine deacetylase [Gammaproteobacteria bacterium RIFCSPHIGHO2_12_FULL_36_30]HLB56142.1 UDP-3-O-acyl-N-acetylglucosamine deacetylase [Coxiellaceae bacterium]